MEYLSITSKCLGAEVEMGRLSLDTEKQWGEKVAALRFFIEHLYEEKVEVEYGTPIATPKTVSVSCTMKVMDRAVTRVGETGLDEPVKLPTTMAYERAFIAAATDLFQLRLKRKVKEPDPKGNAKAEAQVPPLKDADILLFGNFSGKVYGEVKGTEAFQKFLAQLVQTDGLTFKEPDKALQLKQLLMLAGGVK